MYLQQSRGSSESLNICMRLGERAPLSFTLPLLSQSNDSARACGSI